MAAGYHRILSHYILQYLWIGVAPSFAMYVVQRRFMVSNLSFTWRWITQICPIVVFYYYYTTYSFICLCFTIILFLCTIQLLFNIIDSSILVSVIFTILFYKFGFLLLLLLLLTFYSLSCLFLKSDIMVSGRPSR